MELIIKRKVISTTFNFTNSTIYTIAGCSVAFNCISGLEHFSGNSKVYSTLILSIMWKITSFF